MNIEVNGRVVIEVSIPQLRDLCVLAQGMRPTPEPKGNPVSLQQLYAVHQAQEEAAEKLSKKSAEEPKEKPEPKKANTDPENLEEPEKQNKPEAPAEPPKGVAPTADKTITAEDFRTHLIQSRRSAAQRGVDILSNEELRAKIKEYGVDKINDLSTEALSALYAWVDEEAAKNA